MPMNMAHCRYANTLQALRELVDDMDRTTNLSAAEVAARGSLLLMCRTIAGDYETEIDEIVTQRSRDRVQKRRLPANQQKGRTRAGS